MKKKILSMILASLMTLTLASCGSSSASNESAGGTASADQTLDWPKDTVTITLPYNAGGDTDTYCRLIAKGLQDKFGENVVVVNMTGGSGIVAAKEVMAKKPDGYNLFFTHTGAALVQEASGVIDFSYVDDFTNIATAVQDNTYVVVAKTDSGWTNLEDMIAEAKANPGTIRYSQVFGSGTQYVSAQMEQAMGIEFNELDVGTGSAERLAAFMGGQVDLMAINYMNIADYIETGDFIALGVCAPERVPNLDVPTFIEQGYDVVFQKNYELKAPLGTDQAIVDLVTDAVKEITESPEFATEVAKFYAEPFYRTPEEMVEQDKAEIVELEAFFAALEK